MKNSASDILDLILLCAMLVIGATMLAKCMVYQQDVMTEVFQEDKTARRNYTNSILDDFEYTGYDVVLAVAIADQYTPDVPVLRVNSTFDNAGVQMDSNGNYYIEINADPMATVNGGVSDNYVNRDRISYIRTIWDTLKIYKTHGTEKATFSRIWDSTKGEYVWYVTQT